MKTIRAHIAPALKVVLDFSRHGFRASSPRSFFKTMPLGNLARPLLATLCRLKSVTTLLAALALLAPALQAATVEIAGTLSNNAGSQITQWRTAGTAKTFDADGDNLYGTTARLLFGVGGFGQGTVFDIVSNDPIVGPFPGYATVDGVNGGADVQVRTTTNNAVAGADRVMFTFTALAGCPAAVRIGVATDGLDYGFVSPASIGLRQVGGSSAEQPLADGDRSLDMVFFMVSGVKLGDQFQIFGDPSTSHYATIQLVTWDALVVTNANDSGPGSLRAALATAASTVGPDTITFAPGMNGATITLASQITIADTGGVTVDATALSAGVKIDGGSQNFRLFTVNAGASLTLHGLTLTRGGGAVFIDNGGAIRNAGTLTLTRCTLSSHKVASLSSSTSGGAIYNLSTATLTHCTLADNSAGTVGGGVGGAISNDGTLELTHCTVSGNFAVSSGGGVAVSGGSTLTLSNTIIAGNSAGNSASADIANDGTITRAGANLVQFLVNFGTLNGTGTILTNAPLLAPLGSYGGPTQTMLPLPGSPAIDAAVGSTATTDQRGYPIPLDGDGNGSATADIGAVEAQTLAGQNFSFEDPALTPTYYTEEHPGWTDGGAGYDIDVRFIEYLTTPSLFSAQGNQYFGLAAVRSVYQDLPATYEAGAVYRLRVAVGNRAGHTTSGNVSTYTLTTPGGTPALSGTANASTLATAGTFAEAPALVVDTAAQPALVGQRIRVQLTAGGTGRSHFDNVRVDRLFRVINTNDSGPGSLRQAVLDAALQPGADTITFAAPLVAGSVIGLTADLALADVTLDTTITGGSVDVAVNAGTLSFGAGSAWTGGGKILLGATSGSAAATVEVNGPDGFTLAAPITVRAGSSGTKTLRAANVNNGVMTSNTFAGAITLQAPATVEKVNGSALGEWVFFTGPMELGGNVLTVNANDVVYFSGTVGRSDGTGTAQLVKNGGSSLILQGTNDNTRLTALVNVGRLFLEKSSGTALGSGLPPGTNALTVAGGAFVDVSGPGIDQIANTASVTVGGTLYLYASETLDALNGGGTVAAGHTSTLTVGAGNGSGNFAGNLHDGANTFSLTKTGTGTQTVAGGDMTGALTVNGGTLHVTGAFTANSSATVQTGATLAGHGSVRNLTLESGSFLAPENTSPVSTIGTLTASATGATWHPGATARFHLSNTDSNSDRLVVPGTLTKGSTGTGGFVFDFQGTGTNGRTYTLLTFVTPSGFSVGDFTYTGLAPGLTGTLTMTAASLTFTAYSTVVANANDSGPGSLRQAVLDAAVLPGADIITFAPGLTGPITLSSEIVLGSSVTIDATSLPGGLTIDGGAGTNRIFTIASGQTVVLNALTLTGGGGTGTTSSGSGGAIYNGGTLTLEDCTVAGNSATGTGSGIHNSAALTLTRCTFSGNTANNGGGAIFNTGGTLTLARCTLATNRAAYGGAIVNAGSAAAATLTHCTLAQNDSTGTSGSSGGGAIDNYNLAALTLTNCILASNTSATANGPDLWMENGLLTVTGVNLIGNTTSSGLSASSTLLTGDANLAPLVSAGGPTKTIPPLGGSPAVDAAAFVAGLTTDQRGAPLPATGRDLGAVELGQITVTTTADENNGIGTNGVSLREAIAHYAPFEAELIRFAPALNGGTISLSSTILTNKPLAIVDARDLSAGLTIDDGTATNYGLFYVGSGHTLAFHGLTLANGGGADFTDYGGAISNFNGTLVLTHCTLTGNQATFGGAISSFTAPDFTSSSTRLTHCTLTGNTAELHGGAIYNNSGRTTLTHCTLTANTAPANKGSGVASHGNNQTETVLQNTLISGNTGTSVDFINGTNSFQSLGGNLIGSGNAIGAFNQPGDIINNTPQLAPLANYGGPTRTMPPLPGSPAIDPASVASVPGLITDQRGSGFPRVTDGDGNGAASVDSGAVEYDRTVVLTLANTGPGSLRDTFAAAPTGSTLTFAPALSGGTIPLTSEIVLNKNITLDASALPAGVTVDGVAASVTNRIFTVNSGQTVLLKNLTLTGGGGGGALSNNNGGAVYNNGTLTLERCTLTGNNAPGSGGAIFNDSARTLTLTDCTLHANTTSTSGGGAILNLGTLTANKSTLSNNTAAGSGGAIQTGGGTTTTLTHCTLAGNSCAANGNSGSAIRNNGSLSLTHCTLSGNTMPLNFAAGIYNEPSRTITMAHCIVHGNSGSDILNNATLNVTGTSIIGVVNGGGTSSGTILTSNPLLAPLGNYGGPTQTMALLPNSPARNSATGSTITSDQRGFPIVGARDIGAYEAGTFNSYTTYIWESLPTVGNGTIADPLHATTADFDGDGQTNQAEWLFLTDPANSSSRFDLITSALTGDSLPYSFPTALGRTYTLEATTDFTTWIPIPGLINLPGTGSPITGTLGPMTSIQNYFLRVKVTAP